MKTILTQPLILSLIRDSLVNLKLVSGLNGIGLNADDFHVYLGDTIFKLMDLEHHEYGDLIFEKVYLANAQKIRHIRFPATEEQLKPLCEDIYEQLLFARELLKGE